MQWMNGVDRRYCRKICSCSHQAVFLNAGNRCHGDHSIVSSGFIEGGGSFAFPIVTGMDCYQGCHIGVSLLLQYLI